MVSPPPRLQPIPPVNPNNINIPPAPANPLINFQPFNFEGANQNNIPDVPIGFRQEVEAAQPGPLMRQNAVMLGLDEHVPNARV